MSLKFTGAFKSIPFIKVITPPPLVSQVFDGMYPSFQGATYDTASNVYDFFDNGLTIQKKVTTLSHAVINTNIYNDRRYVEWRINDIRALSRLGWTNAWGVGSTSAITSTTLNGVWLRTDGTVFSGSSTTVLGKYFPELKNGDIVGMVVDASGAGTNTIKTTFHVNGVWATLGSPVTTQDMGTLSYSMASSSGIAGSITPMVQVLAATGLNITLNAGQLSTPYLPANYNFLGYRDHKVRLMAGYGGVQVNDTRVSLTNSTVSTSFIASAYSSVPIPNMSKMYFEVTAHKVGATNSRFGTRHYRRSNAFLLGGASDTQESGILATSLALTVNGASLNRSGARATPVSGTKTWGFAMNTPQYFQSKWYLRDEQGWMGTPAAGDPASLGLDWDPYGNMNLENYFCITEPNVTVRGEWSINAGAEPFKYGVPSGYQSWNDIMATRNSYLR